MFMTTLRTVVLGLGGSMLALTAQAADVAGAHDHPLLTRFPGSSIRGYTVSQLDETHLPVKVFTRDDRDKPTADKVLTVQGKITYLNYMLPEGTKPLEVVHNYEEALTGKGFQVLYKCGGNADPDCSNMASYLVNSDQVFKSGFGSADFGDGNRYLLAKRPNAQGDVYVLVYAMDGGTQVGHADLMVVEVKPMSTGQIRVLDAKELQQDLANEGKVAVYGIYFDTAKADVKPESKPSLDEMAKLLKADKTLKVYIVGHTDNQGTLAGNLDLSQHRAESVVKALVGTYQIEPARLAAKGVASLAPVATNTNDKGRALNRRVELVVQ
jgi:OmpA-OmpF porin, OOP family